MKKPLLYLFLLFTSISFAQNWQSLGAAQFTDNAEEFSISYHPTTGEEYVAYVNSSDNNKLYVKKFDGTNWVDVGTTASNFSASLISIEFNPVTKQPWVSYKRDNADAIYVKYFDGTTWQTNDSDFTVTPNIKTQLRFDAAGNAFLATVEKYNTSNSYVKLYSNKSGNWAEQDILTVIADTYTRTKGGFSFPTYNQLSWFDNTIINGTPRSSPLIATYDDTTWSKFYLPNWIYNTKFEGIASTTQDKYWVADDNWGGNEFSLYRHDHELSVPSGTANNTHNILDLVYNANNKLLYLMYADVNNILKVQSYNTSSNNWTELTNLNVDYTGATNAQAKLKLNEANGQVYAIYMDDNKVTIKYIETHTGPVIYVNKNATGNNTGKSWSNAFTDLKDALSIASDTKEIWVAKGTYTPGTNREDTFELYSNTKLYGGFNGTETNRSERNPKANTTVLSGDLNNNDNNTLLDTEPTRSDNAYHVTRIVGLVTDVIVDGFTISGGNANGTDQSGCGVNTADRTINNRGAAVEVYPYLGTATNGIKATFKNCIFEKNTAQSVAVFNGLLACGITNKSFDVDFESCIVRDNYSESSSTFLFYGSSGYTVFANGSIVNSLFYNNTSANAAAAIYLGSSTANGGTSAGTKVDVINTTFTKNTGVSNIALQLTRVSQSNFYNNIIYGNGSTTPLDIIGAAPTASNNIVEGGLLNGTDSNPLFVDADDDNFRLQSGSPAIDTGDNSYIPTGITTDLYGDNRLFNTTVDMGAYEYGNPSPPNYTLSINNPANGTINSSSTGSSYVEYSKITLTATPDTGYQFKEWSGDASGSTNPLTVSMDADKTISAIFEIKKHTLTTNTVNNGTITVSPNPTNGTYDYGTTVTLTANPIAGSGAQFVNWTGDASGTTITTTVVIDGDKTVTANFSKGPVFVNANAKGANDGSSWANAYTDLQSALRNAIKNDIIYVASGTYKPGNDVSDTFIVDKENLKIYGGFNGTETTVAERDLTTNPTILSGDLNDDDAAVAFFESTRNDNSSYIVRVFSSGVLLDGLHIENGDNADTNFSYGSAILIDGKVASFTLKNCEIKNNVSKDGGVVRGYFEVDSDIIIENCTFDNNLSRWGAGLYLLNIHNFNLNVTIANSLFSNNKTMDYGSNKGITGSAAWIRNYAGPSTTVTATITNCTFANNKDLGTLSSQKGPLAFSRERIFYNQIATVNNSIFYGNTVANGYTTISVNKGHVNPSVVTINNSIAEDGFSNIATRNNTSRANPLFTDAANNDFTLQAGSPAIDTGDNTFIPTGITTDLSGNKRIFNTAVDMGAYEYFITLGVNDLTLTKELKLYPNPAIDILNIKSNLAIKRVSIFNIQGQEILKSKTTQIDVSNFTQGLYLIKIETESGSILSKRFIKN